MNTPREMPGRCHLQNAAVTVQTTVAAGRFGVFSLQG